MAEQPTSYLSFSTSPGLVSITVVLVVAGFALSYWNWKRSRFRRDVLWLELTRSTVILATAILLNQPEWLQEFRPTEPPKLVVLVDRSASMETRDVVSTQGSSRDAISRVQASEALADRDHWRALANRFQVDVRTFPSQNKESTDGTNLSEVLSQVIDSESRVQAVVLASDGDWNRGVSPVDVAMRYRTQNVPIFSIPIGSVTRLPDLELLSLDAPTFGIAGKAVRVPFTVESALPREHVVTVSFEASDGEKQTKEVRIGAMSKTVDSFVWVPKEPGDYSVSVSLPPHPDELLLTNNKLAAPISIRQEKLRVLVIETYPRWEYRYLRNALSRDPGVEVSCLLLHPELGKSGGGNRDYIKEFPNETDQLSTYDVVFVGDIGVGAGQLTEEQCKQLRGIVEFQATGLVFLPGPQGNQSTLANTSLDPLIPVLLDPSQPNGIGRREAMHFELTESGRRSLLTKLADTDDDNLNVWSTLPGFQWYAPVVRAKAGSEVLSVHQETANEFGRIPLIVTKTMGAGKVLYMASDGAWRWRKGVEDKYHYRFWGQVVRWMAYQRNMAKGESIRFYYSPEQPSLGQTLSLKANVMSATGEPLSSGEVSVKIEMPDGETTIVPMETAGVDSWGLFEGRFAVTQSGMHQAVVACKETGSKLEASFFVQGSSRERIGLPAKPKILEEIAKVSRGESVSLEKQSRLMDIVGRIPDPPNAVKRWQLWAHPWTILVLTSLLSLFWIGRKWVGLL